MHERRAHNLFVDPESAHARACLRERAVNGKGELAELNDLINLRGVHNARD